MDREHSQNQHFSGESDRVVRNPLTHHIPRELLGAAIAVWRDDYSEFVDVLNNGDEETIQKLVTGVVTELSRQFVRGEKEGEWIQGKISNIVGLYSEVEDQRMMAEKIMIGMRAGLTEEEISIVWPLYVEEWTIDAPKELEEEVYELIPEATMEVVETENRMSLILSEKGREAAIKFVDTGRRTELKKFLTSNASTSEVQQVFEATIYELSELSAVGEIKPRHLSARMGRLMELDDSKDRVNGLRNFRRIRNILEKMGDEELFEVTKNVSVERMVLLDMTDKWVCSPKRMASYVRHYCGQIGYRMWKIRQQNKMEEMHREKRSKVATDFIELLRVVEDRSDGRFFSGLVQSLKNTDANVPAEYVISSLSWIAEEDDGSLCARELLSCLLEDGRWLGDIKSRAFR